MKKNSLTIKLIYVLVGVFFIYGIGLALAGSSGTDLFTFSDGAEFKRGLQATDKLSKVSESWIAWEIEYTDGTSDTGRSDKNDNSIVLAPADQPVDKTDFDLETGSGGTCNSSQELEDPEAFNCIPPPTTLSLVNSKESNPKILSTAEFVMFTDFSKIGSGLCVGTPSTKITETVRVNGQLVNMDLRQLLVFNELGSNNILKGIGVRHTPSFFEGQILIEKGPLKSGDVIDVFIEGSGRFDIIPLDSNGQCPTKVNNKVFDGFIEDVTVSWQIIYADPLDLASGTFPNTQTDITDTPTVVKKCENGVCDEVVVSFPTCPAGQVYNIDEKRCDRIESTSTIKDVDCGEGKVLQDGQCILEETVCIAIFDPVCGSDRVTYSNSCIALGNGIDDYKDGICEREDEFIVPEVIDEVEDFFGIGDDNPSGTNGIVGICDPTLYDCSEGSPDIEEYIKNVRGNEFAFNSFEVIMLIIIGIVIVVIVLSKLAGKNKRGVFAR